MNYNFLNNNNTIKDIFKSSLKKYTNNNFLEHAPLSHKRNTKYTYYETSVLIDQYKRQFQTIGLSTNDRVAIMIGNVPEYFIIKLSLNIIGVSIVPLNSELKSDELEYIFSHCQPKLIIATKRYQEKFKVLNYYNNTKIGLFEFNNLKFKCIKDIKLKNKTYINKILPSTEASLLYTSGTTGKPKGCILSHSYEINAGLGYIKKKGLISIKSSEEKIYNCLPIHHVNAGVLSFFAVLLSGNCQIQAQRFSSSMFWKDIKLSKATIFHYLGVIVSILLKKNKSSYERNNNLRLGVGAGIEPHHHKLFEKRFGIPMVELWGMTEMVRCIFDHKKNRKIGIRCFGKSDKTLETKVINTEGKTIINKPGDFLIRHNKKDPKKGFFSGYLKDKKSTDRVWKDGWFHTGDIVKKDIKGNLFFIDRKKSIIRRAGENISATEVESTLLSLPYILNCAVIAIPHALYEEEVLAFITLKNKRLINKLIVERIMFYVSKKLAYFKLPCYIQFIKNIPKTSTEKNKKNELHIKIDKSNESIFFDVSELKNKMKVIT